MKIIFSTDLLRPFKILNHQSRDNYAANILYDIE